MKQVESGDTVRVHYTGKLTDGTVFDSSVNAEPLEFTMGSKQIIPGFEDGVLGMSVGESKTVEIQPEDAYGHADERLVYNVDRAIIPDDLAIKVGEQLQMNPPEGNPMVVTVTELTDDKVTLDANHPLAGQTLVFDIELMEIV